MSRSPLNNTIINGVLNSAHVSFKIVELLGSGGSGYVYLCQNLKETGGKYYALKEIYPKELSSTLIREIDNKLSFMDGFEAKEIFNWYKDNLKNEVKLCQIASKSRKSDNNDPYFLNCLGIIEANNTLYACYDTMQGISLERYIKKSSDTKDINYLKTILAVLAIASKKLNFIHQSKHPVLHLDLKPSNFFLIQPGNEIVDATNGFNAYLLDFGSAYDFSNSQAIVNHRYSITNGFSAPELYARSHDISSGYNISAETDTYSLTAILFYSLLGRKYDEECMLGFVDWEDEVIKYPNGKTLIDIIKKGLSSQGSRYKTADDFSQALLNARGEISTNGNSDISHILSNITEIKIEIKELKSEIKETNQKIKRVQESVEVSTENITSEVKKEANNIKKHITKLNVLVSLFLLCIVVIILFINNKSAEKDPPQEIAFSISNNSLIAYVNESISFTVEVDETEKITSFNLTPEMIKLSEGVDAEILISGSGYQRTITLNNIHGKEGFYNIAILEGVVIWRNGKKSSEITSEHFYLSVSRNDSFPPRMQISMPKNTLGSSYIDNGDTLSFEIEFLENLELSEILLSDNMIDLEEGLSGNVNISEHGNKREVTISNIHGTAGKHSITIKAGAAIDKAGNLSLSETTSEFYIRGTDEYAPDIIISPPTKEQGNSVSFYVYIDQEKRIDKFDIREIDIKTNGFVADLEILGNGAFRKIICSNIESIYSSGGSGSITVSSGVVVDTNGNSSQATQSAMFDIDTSRPAMTISAASKLIIEEGQTVSYLITVNDNVGVSWFGIRKEDIQMIGFSADIFITTEDTFQSKVTFSNIVSTSDEINKYFKLSPGVAKDDWENETNGKTSPLFKIKTHTGTQSSTFDIDKTAPTLAISNPSDPIIYGAGKTVSYLVEVSDNIRVSWFEIRKEDIQMIGFSADISITKEDDLKAKVTFSNIVSPSDDINKYFKLYPGVAKDDWGNETFGLSSPSFSMDNIPSCNEC